MEQTTKCAVVTGANRGMGLEICRQLASNGIFVVLTARDETRGLLAVENIKESGFSNVVFHQLDITDPVSIASLESFIRTRFGKLDILVNNAFAFGIVMDLEKIKAKGGFDFVKDCENAEKAKEMGMEEPYDLAEECLKTNYYGMKALTDALLPLLELSDSGRIVFMTSLYGLLKYVHNEKVKSKLRDIESLTEQDLEDLVQRFFKDFKDNSLESNGWSTPVAAYKLTQVLINTYIRILARKFPKLLINGCDPGYVKTDEILTNADLTPEEGARAPVNLALLPDDSPTTGCYFNRLELSSFE